MKHLIKIENLQKSYDDFHLKLAELKVEPGTITGLIGANGAGKTTTIKALLGIIEPDRGTVELFGCKATDSHAFSQAKSRIGVVLDTCPFPPDLTVKDASLVGRSAYEQWDQGLFEELASRFNLNLTKKTSDLSRGMGMKLQLAFALAHKPDLLILDEPTAGLDPIARLEVLDLLRESIGEGRGALVSTHITSDLEKLADYVCCIDAGQLAFSTDVDSICDRAGVLSCRASELDAICEAKLFDVGSLRVIQEPYGIKALVPDRYMLGKAFPELACERASVESYMTLMLKGEPR